jgi:F0F1-type ATP synthase delta subunit
LIINSTIELLLNSIKENIDHSLLRSKQFVVKKGRFLLIAEVIKPIIDLLHIHADMAHVKLEFNSELSEDPRAWVDKLRV